MSRASGVSRIDEGISSGGGRKEIEEAWRVEKSSMCLADSSAFPDATLL